MVRYYTQAEVEAIREYKLPINPEYAEFSTPSNPMIGVPVGSPMYKSLIEAGYKPKLKFIATKARDIQLAALKAQTQPTVDGGISKTPMPEVKEKIVQAASKEAKKARTAALGAVVGAKAKLPFVKKGVKKPVSSAVAYGKAIASQAFGISPGAALNNLSR